MIGGNPDGTMGRAVNMMSMAEERLRNETLVHQALDVLFVDDEPGVREPVVHALRSVGHRVTVATDGAEALALVEETPFDVVVTDIRLPKVDGFSILRQVREDVPGTDVVLITAFGSIADAVSAMRERAFDYVTKPFEPATLVRILDGIAERRLLRRELAEARSQLAAADPGNLLVGRSPAMLRLLEQVEAIAESEATVLLTGESGTGKELVAKTIHERGPRRSKPFVALNCAAIPPTLIEAELFGHERGAFTGAVRRRVGRFMAAHDGTLFLDEIAELPLDAQAKLLRVLEEGSFEPIGTNVTAEVDVRLVSATNRDLKALVAQGRFREDLYYRIRVVELVVPPLRERPGDLPLLVEHFLKKHARPDAEPHLSPAAWAALRGHSFPGNVRELQHAIEHAVVLSRRGEIGVEHLPPDIRGPVGRPAKSGTRSLAVALREFEREYILRTLELVGGERQRAAALLGISRKSLWEKVRRYGIERRRARGGAPAPPNIVEPKEDG
jgi:DNA-binding NtrC family response regulator